MKVLFFTTFLYPLAAPLFAAVGPAELIAAAEIGGGTAATGEAVLTACGGDCSDETQLVYQGINDWLSSGGLRYFGTDPNGLNRVQHVLRHTVNDLGRRLHGVFTIGRNEVLPLLDEAYAAIQSGASNVTQLPTRYTGNPNTAFLVDFGERIIGYEGGSAGAGPGNPISILQIVLTNANQVITAYPAR